ncbi:hypothetical protein ABK040_005311 [Willaertia magna]
MIDLQYFDPDYVPSSLQSFGLFNIIPINNNLQKTTNNFFYKNVFTKETAGTFYLKFLTNNSFNVFFLSSIFLFIFHLIYFIILFINYFIKKKKNLFLEEFPFFESFDKNNFFYRFLFKWIGSFIWIFSELNHVSSCVVSFGFWILIIPTGNFPSDQISFVIIATHAVTFGLNVIDFLLSDFYFKFNHLFVIGLFGSGYLLWVIFLFENNFISELPYGSLLNYKTFIYAPLAHLLFILVFYFVFIIYWIVSVIKKLIIAKFCNIPVSVGISPMDDTNYLFSSNKFVTSYYTIGSNSGNQTIGGSSYGYHMDGDNNYYDNRVLKGEEEIVTMRNSQSSEELFSLLHIKK